MDFINIGPQAFANKEETVINWKGENFYRACGVIVQVTRYGTTSCVKRVDHPGEIHEDYDGNTKDESGPRRLIGHSNEPCAICKQEIGPDEMKFKCCPKHTSGPRVVCAKCNETAEHGQ